MSAPKIIVQIAIAGAQILGKAFLAAGRQALANAKHTPDSVIGGDVAGLRSATSGSITDKLTREHRMTLDEARLILNVKKDDPAERISQHYHHLFKANSPPAADAKAAKPKPGTRPHAQSIYSHYLQSKVVRARERIEAELKAASGPASEASQTTTTPPPPSSSSSAPPPENGKSS
ncbi:unnamed protein product [Somion occarium]|uniref:Mitochondrial import inner membrane translocase subunit TIM16 n=1 Tax=Somion occarium TaxID=3059160 RepID=A0ABP1DHK6_9APHY